MKRSVGISVALLSLLCSLWVPSAFGQAVYGSILGTVTDPSGAAVTGAKITVTSQTKNVSTEATTNESGNYSVTHLIPDVYIVRIEGAGFKSLENKNVQVSADTGTKIDGQFQVGGTSETVEVTSEAPQLKTDRADVATELNSRYVEDLPVLNRNFTALELLTPGAQQQTGWNHVAMENPQGSLQIFVNGQHFSGTGYELDGTDNQDPILGIIVVNPNLDAITETKISLQNYDAEFGKAVAGLVTVQTKSGSNELHGSGFYFRRTDATQARDPFTQFQKDPLTHRYIPSSRWQQFGATIGGPIIKNKLFFFGDYQGTRQSNGETFKLTVPTTQVFNTCVGAGDGSGFCKLDQYVPFIGNGKPGDPSTLVYDPNMGDPNNGSGRMPFCGPLGCATQPNWIPMTAAAATSVGHPAASVVSPVAQNILTAFNQDAPPTSSDVTNNFIASGSGPFSQNQFDTRIDFTASQSVQVFGRFSLAYFKVSGLGAFGPLGGPGFGIASIDGNSITHNYSLSSGFTKTISSSLLTDFRFGWFKYNPQTHKNDEGQTPATAFGIPNSNLGDKFTSGMPAFSDVGPVTDFGVGLGASRCNCPLVENEQQFQFVNNWTKLRGNHQIKWGGDGRFARNLRIPSDNNRSGEFHFTNGVTSDGGSGGTGLASLLLGDVGNMNRYVSNPSIPGYLNAAERQWRLFFYGQDTWRVTRKLTVNYGLRWENYLPEYVNGKGHGGFANFNEGAIRVAGYGPYGMNGNVSNGKPFAPRLGIAYEINPKTVLRMGYGRSFDMGVFGSNFGHTVTQNLPILVREALNAGNTINPLDNGNIPAFNLAAGPPIFDFTTVVPLNGKLPLEGPSNNANTHIRPTFQRLPTLDAWNVTLQRQLNSNTSIEVAYVANRGTHVFSGNNPDYDINQVPIGAGSAVVTASNGAPFGTACSSLPAGASCSFSFTPTVPDNQRRPFYNHWSYPGFTDFATGLTTVCCAGGMDFYGNSASASYKSMQLRIDRRFSKGLQFMSFYTFSHAYNYDQGYYGINHGVVWGPDDSNRNHVWVTNVVYQLPFGKGKTFLSGASRLMDAFIGGWQITDTTNYSGGLPWTPGFNECGSISSGDRPCRPNIDGSFKVGGSLKFDPINHNVVFFTPVPAMSYPATSTLTVGADTCALARPTSSPFSVPACGAIGNVLRNSFRGPHAFFDDATISKDFVLTERVHAQFRMDAFNLFNHPVLDFSNQDYEATGGNCIDCGGNNGKIVDILHPGNDPGAMRTLQFALKFTF